MSDLEKLGVNTVIEVIVKGGSHKIKSYFELKKRNPPKGGYRSVNINIPEEQYEKLLEKVKRMNTTVNKVVNDYIDKYLDE